MATDNMNIEVAIITADPFFTHVAYSLIGKDRKTRIWGIASSFEELQTEIESPERAKIFDILICDLDSMLYSYDIQVEVQKFQETNPSVKILCLCEGVLHHINNNLSTFSSLTIDGLVAKSDLDYCLHLAIHCMYLHDITLASSKTSHILGHRENLCVIGKTMEHPEISEAVWDVALLRIFVGLDNPDISDELVHAQQTVRAYMTKTYKAFKDDTSVSRKNLERRTFESISEWWWQERFNFTS